jgi:hypothetical protein
MIEFRVITEAITKYRSFFYALKENGVISALITLLASGDNDSLRILTCKALLIYAEDPASHEVIRLAGGIMPLLNLLRSRNEFVQLQASWYFRFAFTFKIILWKSISVLC